MRNRIIEETDKTEDGGDASELDDDASAALRSKEPSAKALAKITDYCESMNVSIHVF